MSLEDIARVKRDFVASAQRAVAAGIEYIEIHAAHGYLFSEFLSSTSNKRTDAYGGSFENRTRFLRETAAEIKAVLPETVVFGVRLTCEEWVSEGWHIEDTIQLVGQLESAGVDFIDCSSGGNNAKQKIPAAPGFQVPFAEAVKKAYPNLAIGAVGLLTEPNEADLIVSSGRADVTLLGREFLRNPHWPLDAAQALGYDIEWAPQYQWGKRNRKTGVKHKSEL
jgi:2,4-dienoyl-CoA reductase-like NADH-dependent reductase (Old Yellow Enzyme family)